MEHIKWEMVDGNYRNMRAEIDNYLLVVSGSRPWEFDWAVFFMGNSILSSKEASSTRNVPQAQKLCEAVYLTHKNCN